ncbi:MAG: purine-nucleoside phosphorylase [Deferrisomatales bacterium]
MGAWADPLAEAARRALGPRWEGVEAAVVLGSGLAGDLGAFELEEERPYEEVPGLGPCAVPGHPGRLALVRVGGRRVTVFRGRRHLYEGLSGAEAAFPARLAAALGARVLVLLSAVGAVDPRLAVGSWVFVEDHLNLMGRNPLEGGRTPAGPPFVDLSHTYRTELFEPLRQRVGSRGLVLARGVLAAFPGPTYETPAEVRMARTLGGAVVGMSTVPEAVWARFLGLDVLAFGRVTNPAAGVAPGPLAHEDVVRRAAEGSAQAAALVEEAVGLWFGSSSGEDPPG